MSMRFVMPIMLVLMAMAVSLAEVHAIMQAPLHVADHAATLRAHLSGRDRVGR